MDIYILSPSFEKLGVIDYCASIIWTRHYCDVGDFEMYLPATMEALQLLVDGNLVMRADDTTSLMVVKTINLTTDEENGDYLTVSGPSIESYIAKRIVWKQTNLSGLVTACVTQLLNENLISPALASRKIDNFAIGTYCDCAIQLIKQITGDNLLDSIINILYTYKYGFNVTFTGSGLLFNIYEGTDRSSNQTTNPYVTFSPEFDNVLSSEYQASSANYKNVALVAGEGQGVARKTYVVGDASGLDRNELFVDAREISSDTDSGTLPISQYNELLAEKGNEQLAETIKTEAFEGEIEPNTNYIYGTDYFLGDLVNVANEYEMIKVVRITEITECWDENGYTCIPTFDNEEVKT